ncbi:MAG: peptidylprolyl isomerase [Polyangiales bacterium]
MSDPNSIAAGKVVSIHYVLRDDSSKELDRSEEGKPLLYLHGARNIVAGLEKALEGKRVGDAVKVTVPPEQGYGSRNRGKTFQMPRSSFPKEVKLERGMQFSTKTQEGHQVPVWIAKVQGPTVVVDPNHPLAGATLHFDVTVADVRDATEEEKQHGHAHGPDGHGHGH